MVAKITPQEMEGVPHHLFSVLEQTAATFDIHQYRLLFWQTVNDIVHRGKVPIVVGGTNYYLEATLRDLEIITQDDPDEQASKLLEKLSLKDDPEQKILLGKKLASSLEALDFSEMLEVYQQVDPDGARLVQKNDVRRLENKLKRVQNHLTESLGDAYYEQQRRDREASIRQLVLRSGLTCLCMLVLDTDDMPWLEARLLQRINSMVFKEGGLVEITSLLGSLLLGGEKPGQMPSSPQEAARMIEDRRECGVLQAIGYKEFLPYFEAVLRACGNFPVFECKKAAEKAIFWAIEATKIGESGSVEKFDCPVWKALLAGIQVLWKHTVQLVKKQQRYIKNRLLVSEQAKLLKCSKTFIVRSVEQFKKEVLPATKSEADKFFSSNQAPFPVEELKILHINTEIPPAPKSKKEYSKCEPCSKEFVTLVDKKSHFQSKGHWKKVRAIKIRAINDERRAEAEGSDD